METIFSYHSRVVELSDDFSFHYFLLLFSYLLGHYPTRNPFSPLLGKLRGVSTGIAIHSV